MRLPRLSGRTRLVISAALLVVLIWWAGPAELLESVQGLDWPWMLAAILTNYVSLAVGTVNVVILTRVLVPNVTILASIRAFLSAWSVGMIAPGKFGDLTYSHFLSDDETNLAPGLAVGIVDKIVTFSVTSVIAVIGLALFINTRDALWSALFALVATVALIAVVFSPRIRTLVRTRILGSRAKMFSGFSDHVRTLLVSRLDILALNLLLTITRVAIMATATMFSFRALHVEVPLLDVVFVQAMIQLVSLIPITLGGLGVRQGTAIVLFDRISGVAAAPVLSQSLILTIVSYINAAIFFSATGARREQRGAVNPDEEQS